MKESHRRRLYLLMLTVTGGWESLFQGRTKSDLETLLPDYLRGRRWFGGKARTIRSVQILEAIPMAHVIQERKASLAMLKVNYVEGKPETYALPLTFAAGGRAVEVESALPQTIVARLHMNGDEGVLYDALWDKSFSLGLLGAIANHRRFTGRNGDIEASPTHAFRHLLPSMEEVDEPAIMKAEQSNTSVVYGNRLILKLFRRLEEGINPDLEVGRFLTERGFAHIPPVAGALEYRRSGGEPVTLAILQGFVFNQGDAWVHTLGALSRYFERVLAKEARIEGVPVPDKNLIALTEEALTPLAAETIGAYLEAARLLGQRTGELHVTLAEGSDDANFAPEPFSDSARQDIYRGMVALIDQIFPLLRQHLTDFPEAVQENAQSILGRESEIRKRFALIRDTHLTAMRIRCHGDYHLGQVLYTGEDFVIIDFEGEPARPLRERRLKGSPLRDVAGMLRSFHYAAYAALIGKVAGVRREEFSFLEPWARFWYLWVSVAFLKAYCSAAGQAPFLPSSREELRMLLEAHLLEKAVYELGYELNNRPDWVKIPLRGILDLLETVR
jgi:maltose alpha-D-glucosyltransferase / alpha-amylase